MRAWYYRNEDNEELFFVHHNFYPEQKVNLCLQVEDKALALSFRSVSPNPVQTHIPKSISYFYLSILKCFCSTFMCGYKSEGFGDIYTKGLFISYSYNPNDLENIDHFLRCIPFEDDIEDYDCSLEEFEVPDLKIKNFQDLCFNNSNDKEIFNDMMQIFHSIVSQIDYISRDLKKDARNGDKL